MAKDSDFNDLAAKSGLALVKDKVNRVLNAKEGIPFGRFIVKADAVYLQVEDKEGHIEESYFSTRLAPIGIARTAEGDKFTLILELTDLDQKTKVWTLPQELIYRSGGDEARVQFVSLGGAFGPGTRERSQFTDLLKGFVRYPRNLDRIILADRTGWLVKGEQRAFVLPQETIGRIGKESVILPNPGEGAPDYRVTGTLEEWQEQIGRYCIGNSRLGFTTSLPLAAGLLSLFQGEGGGFNIVGRSGDGKTTALYVAASVAGPPEGQVKTCDSTANAFESTAVQHNDACLLMDELGQAHPEQIGQVVYKLAGGVGRGRADQYGNARDRRQWRILFLTTGETDLSTMISSTGKRSFAGQELRLADIEADAGKSMGIFENLHDMNTPAELADHLRAVSSQVHGAILHAYLVRLVEEMNDPTQRPQRLHWLKETQDQFMIYAVPPAASGQVNRVAKRFALVAAGGELATHYGLTGWAKGEAIDAVLICFNSWLQRRGTAGQGEAEQLLQQVAEFFERHGESRFSLIGTKSKQPTLNRAGFRRVVTCGMDTENHVYEYFVLPEIFKKELCNGFEPRWAAKVLVEKKLLRQGNDGKAQVLQRLPGKGPTRCYHFPAAGLYEETGLETKTTEENREDPF
jgi:uncharacterized protein (DUF927 family)